MEGQFVIAWGMIEGAEVHDAGGMNGVGNLLIALETGMIYQGQVREPIDFFVIGVPKSHTDQVYKDFELKYGGRMESLN
jgi:hypothetical protein